MDKMDKMDKMNVENIDKYIEKKIENKINDLLKTLPEKVSKDYNEKPIFEYTIHELYVNTLQTIIDILNELTDLYANKEYMANQTFSNMIFEIILKNNRKIYVGIIIIFLSFILYFIDGASV